MVPVSLTGVKAVVPRGMSRLRPGRIGIVVAPPVPVDGRGVDEAEPLAEEVRRIVAANCGAPCGEATRP